MLQYSEYAFLVLRSAVAFEFTTSCQHSPLVFSPQLWWWCKSTNSYICRSKRRNHDGTKHVHTHTHMESKCVGSIDCRLPYSLPRCPWCVGTVVVVRVPPMKHYSCSIPWRSRSSTVLEYYVLLHCILYSRYHTNCRNISRIFRHDKTCHGMEYFEYHVSDDCLKHASSCASISLSPILL